MTSLTTLSKAASAFHKAAQDPMAPIRAAVDAALKEKVSPTDASVKTITWIADGTVKIDIELTPGTQINRSQLEAILVPAVHAVNPALKISVTVSFSSETKVANFRKRLSIKLAQQAETDIKATLEQALQGIPGAKLLDLSVSNAQVDAKIEVPEQHSFTASQLGESLTKAIQSIAPGNKVVPLLSFSTGKTASSARRKSAQDAKAAAQQVITSALSGHNIGLHSFVWEPESKHILVEVGKKMNSKVSTQQISTFLTNQVQSVAPGYSVIATAKLV